MSQAEQAQYRKVTRSCISRLGKHGILAMRGKFVDVAASDAGPDDRPAAMERTSARAATRSLGWLMAISRRIVSQLHWEVSS